MKLLIRSLCFSLLVCWYPFTLEAQDSSAVIRVDYRCRNCWTGKVPVLFRQHQGYPGQTYGQIRELRTDGVLFDPVREGLISNPQPRFYPFNEITALLDSSGKLIYGKVPESLQHAPDLDLYFRRSADKVDPNPVRMRLEGNTLSESTHPAGHYHMDSIALAHSKTELVVDSTLRNVSFSLKPGGQFFLGDLRLTQVPDENRYILSREKYAAGDTVYISSEKIRRLMHYSIKERITIPAATIGAGIMLGGLVGARLGANDNIEFPYPLACGITTGMHLIPAFMSTWISHTKWERAKESLVYEYRKHTIIDQSGYPKVFSLSAGLNYPFIDQKNSRGRFGFTIGLQRRWQLWNYFSIAGNFRLCARHFELNEQRIYDYNTSYTADIRVNVHYLDLAYHPGIVLPMGNKQLNLYTGITLSWPVHTQSKYETFNAEEHSEPYNPDKNEYDLHWSEEGPSMDPFLNWEFRAQLLTPLWSFECSLLRSLGPEQVLDRYYLEKQVYSAMLQAGFRF